MLPQPTRFQVSERSYADVPVVERHPFWQVVLPRRGRLEMEVADQRGCAGAAWYALVPVGVEHRFWAAGPNRLLILDLATELMAEAEDTFTRHAAPPTSAFPILDERVSALGTLLQGELARGNLREPLVADTLGLYAATLILSPDARLASDRSSPAARRLALRARDYLEAAYDQPLTIAEVAREVGASPAHLQRAFRAHVGTSIVAWVQARRLSRARELLLETDLPITDVAFSAGFGDHSYFTRLFSREIGIPPSRYRATHWARSDKNPCELSKTSSR